MQKSHFKKETGSSSRRKIHTTKFPKQATSVTFVKEFAAKRGRPFVHQRADPDFDEDEVPMSKLDFSNKDIYEDDVPVQNASEAKKDKGLMTYV